MEEDIEKKIEDDVIHAEVMRLFGERNRVSANFRMGYGPSSETDLALDPKGDPINVYKPDNPREGDYDWRLNYYFSILTL